MQTYTTISLVAPVHNEAEVLGLFLGQINIVFEGKSEYALEIIFVNDGSTDQTLNLLLDFQRTDSRIRIIDLSRNFGKEAALSAGLLESTGDAVIPIDVDLQDPPALILEMIKQWQEGYEVVLARRINRLSDTWVKRSFANWFYQIHNQIASPKLPNNVGDFRLMDKKVVEALRQLPESNRFMKGLFAWLGFKTTYVDYVRASRAAGQTKFHFWKLLNFGWDGITSFSIFPLRLFTYLGFLISGLSFLYSIFIMVRVLFLGVDLPGYPSLIVTLTFLSGIQLMGIGVLGEYIGRTYIESKRRPSYLIRQIYEGRT